MLDYEQSPYIAAANLVSAHESCFEETRRARGGKRKQKGTLFLASLRALRFLVGGNYRARARDPPARTLEEYKMAFSCEVDTHDAKVTGTSS